MSTQYLFKQLRQMVEQIVDREGPVRDIVLARRTARTRGWQRTGVHIQERVSSIALSCVQSTKEDISVFFRPRGRGPDLPVVFNSARDGARAVDEICMAELIAVARIVASDGSVGEGPIAAMAKRLGMHHVRTASRQRLEDAFESVQREALVSRPREHE